MFDSGDRPNPDALLRRVHMEQARLRRGKLKVFFGYAPGVGKTYRMLQVARELCADPARDLVIGVVETHRRYDTAALLLGLELLPLRKVDYRGRTLEEFDLDLALARKPQVIVVDELAHTNALGSRHPKRWQDVEELCRAGIDVLTTMNVQHVESLNDVVAQITRIRVRETVPDSVLDGADAIELVDVAPEELLQRLKEEKVYLADAAGRAADHFFRRGNLIALRELALRRTAQHVDDDVREYREEHGVSATWPTSDQILVCVGPAPSSGRLIRAAARMAAGLRCPWVAAYVESPIVPLTEVDRERLEAHLRVAESLGAAVTRLSGARVAEALLAHARRHNVNRIVLGKPTHARVRDRLRGSLLDEVVRGSGDIDVHVIAGDEVAAPPATGKQRRAPLPWPLRHHGVAMLLVAVTTMVSLALRHFFNLPDLEMLFLLAVMVTAMWFGRGPALLAAALGVGSYDYFFVPPFHTFTVSDRRYFLTFAMMFTVGLVMSELAGRLRRQERDAITREERTAVLYALTKDLVTVDVPAQIAEASARHAASVFGAEVVVMLASSEGALGAAGSCPANSTVNASDTGVVKWAFEHGEVAGLGSNTLPGSALICAPLRAGNSRLGVLALRPADRTAMGAEQRAFLDVFCRQVAASLERTRLADEARTAALRAKTEEMRSSVLSAVSHDLRTPLASITGAATTLRDDCKLEPATRSELVDSIVDQADRLERLVANLLDMTRLEAGGLALKRDWVPLDEMVGSALTRLEGRLGSRQVIVDIADDVPLLYVDPVLFEQIFINLLENAVKYTPSDTPLDVSARSHGQLVVVDFADRGPGLPAGSEEKIFEKFFRVAQVGSSGAGLGLPICRGIAEAHGGSIRANQRAGGGALFRVSLPIIGSPPSLPTSEGAS